MKVAQRACLVLGGIVWSAPAGPQPRRGLRRETGAGERGLAAGRTRRSEARGAVAVLAALLVLAAGGAVLAQGGAADRVALVIGNSAYEHASELANPVNDATAMRDALTRLGFDVVFSRDADEDAMEDALAAMEEKSVGAAVALVFYAGHGMEMDGANYLVPVDARLSSAAAVGRETVPLDDVLNAVVDATTRIVILDACRNNPFTRSMRGAVRANVRSGGLAAVAAGAGSLVAYAAAEGDVAEDGAGRHSPFTEALLSHIEQPGVDVRIMLGNVGEAVRDRTGRQQPFIYSSLSGEHYLAAATGGANPAAVETALGLDRDARRAVQLGLVATGFAAGVPDGVFGPTTRSAIRAWQRSRGGVPSGYLDASSATALGAPASAPPVAAGSSADAALLTQETVFWQSIQGSTDPADFEAYLELFANGTFARLARNRLAALRGPADAPRPGADPSRPGTPDDEVFRDCPTCPELVAIPAGEFRMGSPGSEEGRNGDEGPQRGVRVERFALGRYEVMFEEYERFAVATGRGRPGDGGWGRGRRPVVNVSWEDAAAYAAWLSQETGARYRLPSEAEWEYAARAGTETRYSWGNDIGRNRANCGGCGSRWDNEQTAAGGSFAANAWGLHDMHGNVWEWVEDCWHDSYRGAPSDGRAWTSGGDCGRRVSRGGSWGYTLRSLRSAGRGRLVAGSRGNDVGFRVARTLD